jgi:hypothetical protein
MCCRVSEVDACLEEGYGYQGLVFVEFLEAASGR